MRGDLESPTHMTVSALGLEHSARARMSMMACM